MIGLGPKRRATENLPCRSARPSIYIRQTDRRYLLRVKTVRLSLNPNKSITNTIHIMDSASINQVFNELYIPNLQKNQPQAVPAHVPSLIMQDKTTDATHHLSCGCLDDACIHKNAWWSYKTAPVRPSLVSARSTGAVSTVSNY